MQQSDAVELSYLIREHVRATELLAALDKGADATMQTEGLRFSVSVQGIITHPELPQMLMRRMFQTGLLQQSVREYILHLNRLLDDQFRITIEEKGEANAVSRIQQSK